MNDSTPPSMQLSIRERNGLRVLEGAPDQRFIDRVDDINRVIEACFSSRVRLVLLYAANLTNGFFDLSSGEAGAILQRLRNYGVRLAVICPPGSVRFSSRFEEMVREEQLRQHFGIFATYEAAHDWLRQTT
jgi:hypothetical protein